MSVQSVLTAAASDIGYVETPVNRQKFGAWYGWNGVAWCDMAVSYWAAKGGEGSAVGKFAGTRAHAAWFRSRGRLVTTPRPGDLVFFAWSGGGMGGIDHIGYVERVLAGGGLQTIEGNTSRGDSREARRNGGGVLRMQRTRAHVACFARPAYKQVTVKALPQVPVKARPLPRWYGRTLREGMHGPDVQQMQRRLNHYRATRVGSADGAFGPRTTAAVKAAQRAHRLPADGVVGDLTARAIGA